MPLKWPLNLMAKLDVNRVDLVPEGADSEAFIKYFKSKGGNTMDFKEIIAKLKPEHQTVVLAAIAKAKEEEVKAGVEAAVKTAFEDVEKAVSCPDCQKLGKLCPTCAAKLAGNPAAIASANAQLAAKKVAPVKKSKDEDDVEEDIYKNLSPAVKAIIEKSKTQAAAAEAVVAKLMEESVEKAANAKVKAIDCLGATPEELVSVYKSLGKADEKVQTTVFDLLEKANTLVKKSNLFEEVGKNKTFAGSNDSWSEIEKAAASIADKDSITKEAAITKAIKQNPKLYEAYINSQNE